MCSSYKIKMTSIFGVHQREWEPVLPYLDHVLLASFRVGLLPSFWEVGFIEQHVIQGKMTPSCGSTRAFLLSRLILFSNKYVKYFKAMRCFSFVNYVCSRYINY